IRVCRPRSPTRRRGLLRVRAQVTNLSACPYGSPLRPREPLPTCYSARRGTVVELRRLLRWPETGAVLMCKTLVVVALTALAGLSVTPGAVALGDGAAPSASSGTGKATDVGKRKIEYPTKAVMASKTGNAPAATDFVNPKVQPGRVS